MDKHLINPLRQMAYYYVRSTLTFRILYFAHSVHIWASRTSQNQWYYYPNGPCPCVTVSASSHSLWLWNWRSLMYSGVCRTTGGTRTILLFTIRDFSYDKPRLLQQQGAGQSFCFILIWIMVVSRSRLETRLLYLIATLLGKEKNIVKHTSTEEQQPLQEHRLDLFHIVV
jgi:hypothetical protein